MSASKQKKIRSDLRSTGAGGKTADQLEAERKSKKFRRNAIITVVVVVIVLAAALLINSNYFYTGTSAITVGGTDYSAAEFNFYYRNCYNTFCNNYSDYINYGILDTSTPLDEQIYSTSEDGDTTWADYFTEQAKTQMSQITALYDAAVASGYTLTQDALDSIETNVSYASINAIYSGYSTDAYLALCYGKGMDEAYYRQVLTKYTTAVEYGQTIYDGFTYTDEELAEYYASDLADTYDMVSYHVYFVSTSGDAYSELDDDAKVEAAHADAEAIADAATEEEFSENVYNNLDEETKEDYEGVESTLVTTSAGYAGSSYSEWLLDSSRKAGDTYVADATGGTYALMFVSRDSNDYNTANVRHILIKAEADEDGNYTDEALAEAKAAVEDIYAQWQEDPTEENFISLANEHSQDTGSNTNGGLYETVYKGQMVDEFNDFCFGDRQPGDTAIVYGSSDSYAGYHLIYYVSDGPVYANYIAENVMRNNDYNDYLSEISAGYDVTTHFSFRFTHRS